MNLFLYELTQTKISYIQNKQWMLKKQSDVKYDIKNVIGGILKMSEE